MGLSVNEYFRSKLKASDLVLAQVDKFAHQNGTARLGAVYRMKYLFANRHTVFNYKEFEFVGGGTTFGETPNYSGELCYLFLRNINGRIYQESWHGHLPIERHGDGAWCLVYQFPLDGRADLPQQFVNAWKPGERIDSKGNPIDAWVRFEAMDSYLRCLIEELDGEPTQVLAVAEVSDWLKGYSSQ